MVAAITYFTWQIRTNSYDLTR